MEDKPPQQEIVLQHQDYEIETLAGLWELPDQTVIRSKYGVIYERWRDGLSDCWRTPGNETEFDTSRPSLPVRVLFGPDEPSS